MRATRIMAVLAHPDDESLGVGGTLAKYASEGADVFLLTATRGDSGRFRGHRLDDPQHPGRLALAKIREVELRAAASALGVREVSILDYHDQHLDRANPREAVANIVGHIRRVQPDIVLTFGPDGAYGHPPTTLRSPNSPRRLSSPQPTRRFHVVGSQPPSSMWCQSFTTSPGRNRRGKLTSQLSGNWFRQSTALNGRPCHGQTGRSPQ
jgi:GlcNAc-PI de-N-acetylase